MPTYREKLRKLHDLQNQAAEDDRRGDVTARARVFELADQIRPLLRDLVDGVGLDEETERD